MRDGWFKDSPLLPIKFARQSSNGRITLVLVQAAAPVRSLWALMSVKDLDEATESLAHREGLTGSTGRETSAFGARTSVFWGACPPISAWAKAVGLDASFGQRWGRSSETKNVSRRSMKSSLICKRCRRNGVGSQRIYSASTAAIDTDYRRRFARELG